MLQQQSQISRKPAQNLLELLKEPCQKILKNKLPQLKQDETTTFRILYLLWLHLKVRKRRHLYYSDSQSYPCHCRPGQAKVSLRHCSNSFFHQTRGFLTHSSMYTGIHSLSCCHCSCFLQLKGRIKTINSSPLQLSHHITSLKKKNLKLLLNNIF